MSTSLVGSERDARDGLQVHAEQIGHLGRVHLGQQTSDDRWGGLIPAFGRPFGFAFRLASGIFGPVPIRTRHRSQDRHGAERTDPLQVGFALDEQRACEAQAVDGDTLDVLA